MRPPSLTGHLTFRKVSSKFASKWAPAFAHGYSTPFLQVNYGGARPPNPVTHTGTLPTRHGRRLILAVWDIADTGNAFYSCADVVFS
ncbi:lytic polysaccharide monooxygenase [Actinoallomurus acaciae]|uniref:Lytic polysaccharide monooxygenase n=1 Tax=Actinoallomurus acaciae TaxID=502577 RepID=A0ABV5YAH3_9ACTN